MLYYTVTRTIFNLYFEKKKPREPTGAYFTIQKLVSIPKQINKYT